MPAFQKAPFCFRSGDTSLPCSTSISVGPTQPRCFQQTLIPLTRQFPLFFGLCTLSPLLSLSFLHFCLTLPPLRGTSTHTHARTKLSFFHFVAFLSKRRACRGKKLHPHPFSVQLGNFNLLQCLIPPFSLFLSLALSHSHTFAHSVQGQEATGHALTTHKGRRREKEAGEKSENIRPSLQIYRRVNTPETTFAPRLWACGPAAPPPAVSMCTTRKTEPFLLLGFSGRRQAECLYICPSAPKTIAAPEQTDPSWRFFFFLFPFFFFFSSFPEMRERCEARGRCEIKISLIKSGYCSAAKHVQNSKPHI